MLSQKASVMRSTCLRKWTARRNEAKVIVSTYDNFFTVKRIQIGGIMESWYQQRSPRILQTWSQEREGWLDPWHSLLLSSATSARVLQTHPSSKQQQHLLHLPSGDRPWSTHHLVAKRDGWWATSNCLLMQNESHAHTSKSTRVHTFLQKYLNTHLRDENTEISCVFESIFNFFYHSRGTPPSRPHTHTLWLCHHPPAGSKSLFGCVHKYLNTFSCCCNFLNIAARWTVFTLLESLKSQQLNLLHTFSEKLHVKGSAGHFVNAVSLSLVLNRIMQSSINIAATQTILTSLESLKTWQLNLSLYFGWSCIFKAALAIKQKKLLHTLAPPLQSWCSNTGKCSWSKS